MITAQGLLNLLIREDVRSIELYRYLAEQPADTPLGPVLVGMALANPGWLDLVTGLAFRQSDEDSKRPITEAIRDAQETREADTVFVHVQYAEAIVEPLGALLEQPTDKLAPQVRRQELIKAGRSLPPMRERKKRR